MLDLSELIYRLKTVSVKLEDLKVGDIFVDGDGDTLSTVVKINKFEDGSIEIVDEDFNSCTHPSHLANTTEEIIPRHLLKEFDRTEHYGHACADDDFEGSHVEVMARITKR